MTELTYPFNALRGDYVRAAIGLVLTLCPAGAIPLGAPADYVLLPAAALFALFGLRTWRRQRCRVHLSKARISIFRPRQVSLDWQGIRTVKLSYFSTRPDRSGGWMQLTLQGDDPQRDGRSRTIRVDSGLDGFLDVAGRAAAIVDANALPVSAATRVNFQALGLEIAEAHEAGQADALRREPG